MAPFQQSGSIIRRMFGDFGAVPSPFGRIYTPRELAQLWQLSENSIRRLFQDEPGVFVLGESNPRKKRGYTTLRIPEQVALRVWRERGGGGQTRHGRLR
jgi:hypothetical protein